MDFLRVCALRNIHDCVVVSISCAWAAQKYTSRGLNSETGRGPPLLVHVCAVVFSSTRSLGSSPKYGQYGQTRPVGRYSRIVCPVGNIHAGVIVRISCTHTALEYTRDGTGSETSRRSSPHLHACAGGAFGLCLGVSSCVSIVTEDGRTLRV